MLLLSLAIAFLLGSIPFSWILVWLLKGEDLRKVGSGNPGATNAIRVAGKGWGYLALALDITKGFAAVALAPRIPGIVSNDWLPVACGLAAILGNIYCPFLRFKGGKAVATSAGVFLALVPWASLVGLIAFGALFLPTQKVSAGSLAASIALPVAVTVNWTTGGWDQPTKWTVLLVWTTAILVVWRHRENIKRLLSGEEASIHDPATERD